MVCEHLADLLCVYFSILGRNCNHLVTGRLNCPGFMTGDMTAGGGHDCLMRAKNGGNHRGVCLSSADQKVNVHFIVPAGSADYTPRFGAEIVLAIAGSLLSVGFHHRLKYARMRAFSVITFKSYQVSRPPGLFKNEPKIAVFPYCFIIFT